jgi:hypothetical protein
MARENPTWGYTRLRGALRNLGSDLGRSTIQRILKEHGIEPAPLRGRTMPWKTGALGRHLRTAIRQFVEHDHSERNHQGLGNVIPFPSAVTSPDGRVCRRERLGGLLSLYERRAA